MGSVFQFQWLRNPFFAYTYFDRLPKEEPRDSFKVLTWHLFLVLAYIRGPEPIAAAL
jgi:hypothetical protein